MVFDIEALLAPISPDLPAGPNLRSDSAGASAYYRVKDARSAARVAERQADAEADRGGTVTEWRLIFEEAQTVLAQQSKDLEIATWLTEAALRLHGYAGLRDGFNLLKQLVERYWDGLHSVDADDMAGKVAPLAGLNGLSAEGTLIQPLRLAPLTAPSAGPPAGLWHYMMMRKRGATCPEAVLLSEALAASDRAALIGIFGDIENARFYFSGLIAFLDEVCGADSPPSSTIRNTLVEAEDALRDFAVLQPAELAGGQAAPAAVESAAPAVQQTPRGVAAAPAPPAEAVLRTREDALRELARIATFFRETEPNSPTAYTLTTLIRRARLPLVDLLRELIPDEGVRRGYLNVAGIGPEVIEK